MWDRVWRSEANLALATGIVPERERRPWRYPHQLFRFGCGSLINPSNSTVPIKSPFPQLGVENGVTSIPSHSEPDLRLSPHPAPSLNAHCHWYDTTTERLQPSFHRDSADVVTVNFGIHLYPPLREAGCGLPPSGLHLRSIVRIVCIDHSASSAVLLLA